MHHDGPIAIVVVEARLQTIEPQGVAVRAVVGLGGEVALEQAEDLREQYYTWCEELVDSASAKALRAGGMSSNITSYLSDSLIWETV